MELRHKSILRKALYTASVITLAIAVFAAGCSFIGDKEEEVVDEKFKADVSEIVKEGYFQEYTTNGEIISKSGTQVSTRFGGVVKEVFVSEGDYVEKDQVLFDYAKSGGENEAELAVTQAEIGLKSAQDGLRSAESAARTAKLNADQAVNMAEQALNTTKEETGLAVKQAKESYQATKESYDQLVKTNMKSVELAEQNVNLAQISYDSAVESRKNIEDSGVLSEEHINQKAEMIPLQVWPSMQSALNTADQIIGVSNKNKHLNNSYEQSLKARDIGKYTNVSGELERLLDEVEEKNWNEVDENISKEELQELEKFAIKLKTTLNSIGEILDNAVVGGRLTEAQRTALRSNVTLAQGNVDAARQTIQSIVQAMESTNLNTDIQLTNAKFAESQAEANLMRAKTTLESTKSQTSQAEASTRLQLIAAENGLESAKTSQENRIEQAELSLANAKTNRDLMYTQQNSAVTSAKNAALNAETTLENVKNNYFNQLERAAASGYLSGFDVESGKSLGRGVPFAFIVQTNDLKVKLGVPVELASAVKKETEGKVICSGDAEVDLKVDTISPIAGSGHNVKLEAVLDTENSGGCRVGELANVIIKIEREETLQIPVSALVWRANKPIVWIVKDKKVHPKEIEVIQVLKNSIAIRSDELKEGDLVLENPVKELTDGQEVVISN